jgi:5'-methylthioinosine phosphorylase
VSRTIGLIVGSGFDAQRLDCRQKASVDTPYGPPASPILEVDIAGRRVACLARHGIGHRFAPHEVNYRANLWALHEYGIDTCIAINVVGGISPELGPGALAVPDQLIDYTWGRESSFGRRDDAVVHVEMTEPFDARLRGELATAISECGYPVSAGTYGVTQGPRLETAAEIDRMQRDGCAMVGMTAMPEAALARELSMAYAICAASVNHAAGRAPDAGVIHAQLSASLDAAMLRVHRVLERFFSSLA